MFCTSCGTTRSDGPEPCPACSAAAPVRRPPASAAEGPTVPVVAARRAGSDLAVASAPVPPAVPDATVVSGPAAGDQTWAGGPVLGASPNDPATPPPPLVHPPGQGPRPAAGPPPSGPEASPARWSPPGLVVAALGLAALVVIGVATPLLGPSGTPLGEDLGQAWPYLLLAGLAVVGAVDLARGNASGLGTAAGVTIVLAGTVALVYQVGLGDESSTDLAVGAHAWLAAALLGAVLLVALTGSPGARAGRAPAGVGVALAAAAVVWAVGVVQPDPRVAISAYDNLRWGTDADTAVAVGPALLTAVVYAVAAVRRTSGALGVALGASVAWLAVWAQDSIERGDPSTLGVAPARFATVATGSIAVAAIAAVAVLLVRSTPPAPSAGAIGSAGAAPPPSTARSAVSLVGLAAIAATVALTGAGLGNRSDGAGSSAAGWRTGYEIDGSDSSYGGTDTYGDGGYDTYDPTYDDYDVYDEHDTYDPTYEDEGSYDEDPVPTSSCPTSANRPALEEYWQDADGDIHLVIVITTDCATDQVLDDPQASFGVYAAGTAFTEATFDFSSDPVALPAYGQTSEIELVFTPGTATFNEDALGRISLPSSAAPARSGIDIRYIFRCEPTTTGEGTTVPSPVSSTGSADLSMDGDDEQVFLPNEPDSLPAAATLTGADALAELERIAAADRAYVEGALFDRWVPQLSAKDTSGKKDEYDVAFTDFGQILDHYLALKARYPNIRLLNSSTYSSFKLDGFWTIVSSTTFATPEEAIGWCEAEGFLPKGCYAKRINNGDYAGNTRTRPGG